MCVRVRACVVLCCVCVCVVLCVYVCEHDEFMRACMYALCGCISSVYMHTCLVQLGDTSTQTIGHTGIQHISNKLLLCTGSLIIHIPAKLIGTAMFGKLYCKNFDKSDKQYAIC